MDLPLEVRPTPPYPHSASAGHVPPGQLHAKCVNSMLAGPASTECTKCNSSKICATGSNGLGSARIQFAPTSSKIDENRDNKGQNMPKQVLKTSHSLPISLIHLLDLLCTGHQLCAMRLQRWLHSAGALTQGGHQGAQGSVQSGELWAEGLLGGWIVARWWWSWATWEIPQDLTGVLAPSSDARSP